MSTVYGENGLTGTGYVPPKRVNFGWLGEAWGLFRENAGLWIFAILIGVYGPIAFNLFVFVAQGISAHVALGVHNTAGVFQSMSRGLILGVTILDIIFTAYIWSGIFRMAVKQVSGEPISFGDIFSGARTFGQMLVFMIVAYVLVSVGTIVILGGLLAGALLLPGFALIASGEPVGSAISKSIAAMWGARFQGMAFVFGLGMIVTLSIFAFGFGPLVTLSMVALISALAYRDMIGLPNSGTSESLESILGIKADKAHAVSLTGESLDETAPK